LKRDRLLKEFKAMFYRSRELKSILSEFSETNNMLSEEVKAKDDAIKNFLQKYKETKHLVKELKS
jgi:hypothetical protein